MKDAPTTCEGPPPQPQSRLEAICGQQRQFWKAILFSKNRRPSPEGSGFEVLGVVGLGFGVSRVYIRFGVYIVLRVSGFGFGVYIV